MAGTAVVLQLISLFFSCVSGAHLQYGNTVLNDSSSNVTLTLGGSETVYCVQATGPVPTAVKWYNPQGQLVSMDGGDVVNQAGAGGTAAFLNFRSYQQSQGGKYECRVTGPGNNLEKLPVCIGPTNKSCDDEVTSVPYGIPPKVSGVRFVPSPDENSLAVKWSRPQSNFSILYYEIQYRSHTARSFWQGPVKAKTESVTLRISLTSSAPYGVQVRAVSEIGAGPYSSEETVKLPTSPTLNITSGSSWLYVEWNAQSATFRVLYRESGAPDYQVIAPPTSQLSHNISALQPNTLYNIVVEATHTVIQQKVNSSVTNAYTTPRAPGPVSELSYEENTNTSVTITWKPPQEPIGDIVAYFVEHGVYQNESTISEEIDARRPMHTVIRALEPGVPYNITVRASTAAGKGEPASIVVFSVQQAPTAQVSNVTVERVNSNRAALVSWTPLTLHQARGFPVYFVTYQPSSQDERVVRAVNTVSTTDSRVQIDDLDPTAEYLIAVDVGTAGGQLRSTLGAVYVTLVAVPSTEDIPNIGADVGAVVAVVAVVGVLLLIGIAIVVVVVIVLRRKTKSISYKPHVRTKEEALQKTSPHSPNVRHEQAKVGDSENIEMIPLPATNDSRAIAESTSQPSRVVHKSHFSEHVKAMHKERDSGFEREYLTIENVPDGIMDIAKAHRSKNRYLNIHTFDASRVVLSVPDVDGSDYINASYIDGYNQKSAYIASQGPNADTVSDFIQMVWDQRPPVLVMLTRLMEKGKSKCTKYWCDEMNKPFEIVDRRFTVTVTAKEVYADYEVRDMTIICTGDPSTKPLKVKHFFFTTWPDHGVPQHPFSMIKFIQHIRKVFLHSSGPLLVHCSAGVGRTGTFIAIDAMMQRLKEEDDLDIYDFVTQMRTKRTYMVQNLNQYAFIHDVLNDYLHCGNTAVVAHKLRMIIADMQKEDPQARCSGFEQQFKLLQELSQVPCMADINHAKKASILKRNRYKDRFPYSTGYIHLPGMAGRQSSKGSVDYYNASCLDGYSVPKAFIAAQSPMSNTKGDFWEMVWQFCTPTIVLLTNFKEGKQEACANVWPAAGHETIDHYDVKCNEVQPCDGYDVIKLEVASLIESDSANLEVTVFHYKKWPRDGNPELLSLLEMMGKTDRARQKDKAAIVMCDDGMSRTGVFIAAMCEVERVKVEGEVDIFQTIKAMRKKRPHMVYNKEQYTLCFELLQMYVDSFDTYANFKALS